MPTLPAGINVITALAGVAFVWSAESLRAKISLPREKDTPTSSKSIAVLVLEDSPAIPIPVYTPAALLVLPWTLKA
jgi:hypothetical protein